MKMKIKIPAKKYEDFDDCLEAAAEDYADEHGLDLWEVSAEWDSEQRDFIVLSVPE